MLKLSKKTEYALMAVKYIALKPMGECITAKEISDNYKIPHELLAKVLQKLSKFQIVKSYQGIKGGYCLTKPPAAITLMDIISAIDSNYEIAGCLHQNISDDECTHYNCCMIRDPLMKIQKEITKIFTNMTVSEML